MESTNFPTLVCTELLLLGRPAIERKKIISLSWSITNLHFNAWQAFKEPEKIVGPVFKFHPLSEELWKLELDRICYANCDHTYLSVGITKVSEGNNIAKQFTVFWSAVKDGESTYLQKNLSLPANVTGQALFKIPAYDFKKHESHFSKMIIQIEIDDNVAQRTVNSVNDYRSLLDKGKMAVLADMESILKGAEFTDIALRSEGKVIRAHRAILAGRSSVFKSMFGHRMSENASGFVDIADVPHDILQLLVTFMYSGRLDNLDVRTASVLFIASDKYMVEDLHNICSLFLQSNLTAENCLEILMLADAHSCKDLKSSALSYFAQNSNDICQLHDWENVIAARPRILLQLFKILAKK